MNIPNTTAGRRLIARLMAQSNTAWDSSTQGTRNLGRNSMKREGDALSTDKSEKKHQRAITRRILAKQTKE